MPPKPPAEGVIQFTVHQSFGDDLEVANVLHMQFGSLTGPATGPDLLTGATDFLTIWDAHFPPHQGGDLFVNACTAKDLGVPNGGDITFTLATPVQGGTGGGDFPANVALCVSWGEFISYRGGHPRTYLCGIPRSAGIDPQHVSSTYANAVAADATAFANALAAHTWPAAWAAGDLVVVHYRLNDAVQTPPLVNSIITARVNTRIDSQRRRLGR